MTERTTLSGVELARQLITHGIPVVVCQPVSGWKADGGNGADVRLPTGWNRITPLKSLDALDDFRPGVDCLAMVAGWGLDVIDIDAKAGGHIDMLPDGVDMLGVHRTPSGGWHVFVRSTGLGKISPLVDRSTGVIVGDFAGGLPNGSARMLVFLPGSWRPKYEDAGYTVQTPIDFSRLAGEPDPVTVSWLLGNGASSSGSASQPADAEAAATWLAGLPSVAAVECRYGQAALSSILAEAPEVEGGRHAWGLRSITRIVELVNTGCLGSDAVDAWRDRLTEISDEESPDLLLSWAVANATGVAGCDLHLRAVPEPVNADDFEPVSLEGLRSTVRRWLGDGFDTDVAVAVAAAAVGQRLSDDPAWLLVVGGSSSAKTELVSPLEAIGALVESQIKSEAALLSGTSQRERSENATGGLLQRIGSDGLLVLKDVTSILSMNHDARASMLAALREVYDGRWTRNLGNDGGQSLSWEGRLTLIGGVTTSWDEHHAVVAAMGDRFLLIRPRYSDAYADGDQALGNGRSSDAMRADLRNAFAGAVLHADLSAAEVDLPVDVRRIIVGAASVVARSRSQVVKSGPQGETEWAHEAERSPRLAKQLRQMYLGALCLGLTSADALSLVLRIAFDTIPISRSPLMRFLLEHPGATQPMMRAGIGLSYNGSKKATETLLALNIIAVADDDDDDVDFGGLSLTPLQSSTPRITFDSPNQTRPKRLRHFVLDLDERALEAFEAMVVARYGATKTTEVAA